jgi:hypothetical protein
VIAGSVGFEQEDVAIGGSDICACGQRGHPGDRPSTAISFFGLKAFLQTTTLTWFAWAAAFRVMDGWGKPA